MLSTIPEPRRDHRPLSVARCPREARKAATRPPPPPPARAILPFPVRSSPSGNAWERERSGGGGRGWAPQGYSVSVEHHW